MRPVSALSTYGWLYLNSITSVAVAIGANVIWNTQGDLTGGLSWNATTGVITVTGGGDYSVTYSVTPTTVNHLFGLMRNGVVVAGTKVANGAANQPTPTSVIVSLQAGDTLAVQNVGGSAVLLQGSVTSGPGASIVIEKIS